MALIICPECGKEFSDKAAACPNCGCPTDYIASSDNSQISSCAFDSEDTASASDSIRNFLSSAASTAVSEIKDNFELAKQLKKVGIITINERDRTFQIKGAIAPNGKKTGLIGGLFKGTLAVSTMGMSVAAEKALGLGKTKVGTKDWYDFDDLISYELLEDDSVVTSGGVGQALIGGAIFGAAGAIAGGITGKRTQKKKVDSLYIKVTLNSFSSPCLMIPLITKSIKTSSKEYQAAFNEAHQILSTLDVITHNK